MTIVTLNIPDEFELMPPDQWMKLATMEYSYDRPYLKQLHGNFGTDGYRMHIANIDALCNCRSIIHDAVSDLIEKTVNGSKFVFSINRQFLLDALAGIDPNDNIIRFFQSTGGSVITIQSADGERTAVIMTTTETSAELIVPDVQHKNTGEPS